MDNRREENEMAVTPEQLNLRGMVDIHCHILPGVDDGARTWEESLAMCELAAADGIGTIVATPHMFDGVHRTPEKSLVQVRLGELRQRVKGMLEILPGGEVRYSYEIFQEAPDPQTKIRLNGTSYMLLEFPFQAVPPNIEMTIFQILNAGITPVIAHPERNKRIQERPEVLADLVERGAFAQLDAGSLTKSFGPEPYQSAKRIIEAGLAHFIATDAHHQDRRRPILSTAVAVAADIGGIEYARAMVLANPTALIQDRGIPYQLECDMDALRGKRRKKSWFQFWK
jgi:protein-tyrosine phosphatase